VQLHAPAQIRGRVLGFYNTCSNGMRAFSGITVGMAGSLVGVLWSLALSAAALLVVTIALFAADLRVKAPAAAE
jgi:sugar phosphate permease